MTRQKIIDKITDDRIWFVAELGHYPADEGAAAAVPFQVDRTMQIARTVDLRPTVRASRLFRPGFDKTKFLLQLGISRDLAA